MSDKQNDFENQLDQEIALNASLLSPEQQSRLSKVLFPTTHTDKIQLGGKERTLHPLPVKFSRQLHEVVLPFASRAEEESTKKEGDGSPYEVDKDLLKAVLEAVRVLCDAYGEDWDDVKGKLEREELVLSELQNAVVQQQELQGQSDFTLTPLRVAIKVMKAREIVEIMQQDDFGTASIGQQPSSDSDAPSTS